MGCLFLLCGIFLTQGLNLSLPLCKQTPNCLSHQGSPISLCRCLSTFSELWISLGREVSWCFYLILRFQFRLWNLFRLILWPKICSVLVNTPRTLEKRTSSAAAGCSICKDQLDQAAWPFSPFPSSLFAYSFLVITEWVDLKYSVLVVDLFLPFNFVSFCFIYLNAVVLNEFVFTVEVPSRQIVFYHIISSCSKVFPDVYLYDSDKATSASYPYCLHSISSSSAYFQLVCIFPFKMHIL